MRFANVDRSNRSLDTDAQVHPCASHTRLVCAGQFRRYLAVMRKQRFLRTDERDEAVRSLEWSRAQAAALKDDPYLWKWVLIALHNSVQGFMVLALWNGNGLLTLKPKIAQKWLAAYQAGGPFPAEKLDEFLNLYEKTKDPANFHTVEVGPFVPGATHDESVRRLNVRRNYVTHFTPKGWSLELAGLPKICLDVLDVVRFLGWESTAVNWYKPAYVMRAKRAHNALRKDLLGLQVAYAS